MQNQEKSYFNQNHRTHGLIPITYSLSPNTGWTCSMYESLWRILWIEGNKIWFRGMKFSVGNKIIPPSVHHSIPSTPNSHKADA